VARGWELFLLNRGQRHPNPPVAGAWWRTLTALKRSAPPWRHAIRRYRGLGGLHAQDIERDLVLFRDRTQQYIFISSASAYQKPPAHYIITESTPLHNPHWNIRGTRSVRGAVDAGVSREGFPVTIVRPSLNMIRSFRSRWGAGVLHLVRPVEERASDHHSRDGSSLWW